VKILKAIFFYPLLMLRRPALLTGKFIAGIMVLAGLLTRIPTGGTPVPWGMSLGAIFGGVVVFVLCQLYDQILIKLNPTDNELVLFQ
jgi:hypothetical protein